MGEDFEIVSARVINYAVVRPATSVLAFISERTGYTRGEILNSVCITFLMFINNLSQAWAMYCLILLYKACTESWRSNRFGNS